jgi:hypothetical protein
MADKAPKDDRLDEAAEQSVPEGDDDTEGHLMMPNIAAARALANERTGSAERNARFRIRQKDERPGEKRAR